MTREEWIEVFKKIPETMHDQIVLSVSTGIDVYVQRLLQVGEQNVLIRGRLGGTDEGERIFLVPWPELRVLFFSRPVGDEMMYGMFGELIGGIRKSAIRKKADEEEIEEEEEQEAEPMHLTPSYNQQEEEEMPKRGGVNLEDVRQRLLQPRKPPPRTETNKPGLSKPPSKPAK